MSLILDENTIEDFKRAFYASITFKDGQAKIRLAYRNEANSDVDSHYLISDSCGTDIDCTWSFSYLGDENKSDEAYFSVLAHFLKVGDHLGFHLANTSPEVIKIYACVRRFCQNSKTLKNKFTIALDEKTSTHSALKSCFRLLHDSAKS